MHPINTNFQQIFRASDV